MRSARINEVRESKLFYATEPLKQTSLNDPPQHVLYVRLLDIEFDEVVEWIANPLLLGHSSESPDAADHIIEQNKNPSTSL